MDGGELMVEKEVVETMVNSMASDSSKEMSWPSLPSMTSRVLSPVFKST